MPSPDVRRGAARLRGALLRSHQRFGVDALARLHPDLTADQLAAAVAAEQAVDGIYLSRMMARADAGARWALDPNYDRAQQAERLGRVAARERRHLAAHLDHAGRRLGVQATLARMRALGDAEGYWLGGDRPGSCRGCRAMGSKVWPLGAWVSNR